MIGRIWGSRSRRGFIPVRPYAQTSELHSYAFRVKVKVVAGDRESDWVDAYAKIYP